MDDRGRCRSPAGSSQRLLGRVWRGCPVRVLMVGVVVGVSAACGGDAVDRGGAADEERRPPTLGTEAQPTRPAPEVTRVTVVFTREEEPVAVERSVTGGGSPAHAAVEALLGGPDEAERAEGLHSWFSSATARSLRSIEVDEVGHTVVDFHDLRPLISGASSAAGSEMLLHQLNGTLFALPEVMSVEYRIDGSCEAFWAWLQRECTVVTRP
jgi:hypothetical protein